LGPSKNPPNDFYCLCEMILFVNDFLHDFLLAYPIP
jgi:hypothetical protein